MMATGWKILSGPLRHLEEGLRKRNPSDLLEHVRRDDLGGGRRLDTRQHGRPSAAATHGRPARARGGAVQVTPALGPIAVVGFPEGGTHTEGLGVREVGDLGGGAF